MKDSGTRYFPSPFVKSVAVSSGAFCVLVAALLLWNHQKIDAEQLRQSCALAELKAKLHKQPTDENLKQTIRQIDAKLRGEFFQRQHFSQRGAWLLAAGLVLLVFSARTLASRQATAPQVLQIVPNSGVRGANGWARWAVAGVMLLLAGGIGFLMLSFSDNLPVLADGETNPAVKDTPLAPVENGPSEAEYKQNWPRFRGPDGSGISAFAKAPESWDGAAGKNILWQAEVPLPGHNSPVVWGKRIFVSGATDKAREVYCFDADSGKMLWKAPVTPQNQQELNVMESTGYAASTVATDGRRVYAIFPTGDMAAFTFEGKPAWSHSFGPLENGYGHAASLITWKNLLIVQLDQSGSPEDGKSKLFAFDGATGKEKWSVKRPVANSWTTPLVIANKGQEQIVTSSLPNVIAYEPAGGKELWWAQCMSGDVAPSPVFANGMVFVVNAGASLAAIRVDGTGDVTQTHIAWQGQDGLPDITSPLCDGARVYLLTSSGTLTCYQADDGKKLWEHECERTFDASPALAGNKLYLTDKEGVTTMLEPADTFKPLPGTAPLGEPVHASPAFGDGRIYIRGEKHLFAIGEKVK